MTLEQGLTLTKHCIAELKTRFFISQTVFIVKVITKEGIQTMKMWCLKLKYNAIYIFLLT